MKICTKKVYCPNCRRLVKCREKNVNSHIHIVCSRCDSVICIWNGYIWKNRKSRQQD